MKPTSLLALTTLLALCVACGGDGTNCDETQIQDAYVEGKIVGTAIAREFDTYCLTQRPTGSQIDSAVTASIEKMSSRDYCPQDGGE